MSNFDFIRAEWPQIFESCVKAEANHKNDPRAACFYARRSAELVTDHIYDIAGLPAVHDRTFINLLNAPGFQSTVEKKILDKLHVLRKVGNDAVHDDRPVRHTTGIQLLNELFHVVIWAAQRYSTTPDTVPVNQQFDPARADQVAPVPREKVAAQLRKYRDLDAKRAQALADREEELEQLQETAEQQEAEIRRLREAVAEAQQARQTADTHDYRESETRDVLIDVLLREAGWDPDAPRTREYPVRGMPSASGEGRVDYVLWGADGRPLGLVEAKRTGRSAAEGQQQAKLYADCLEAETGQRPVIFYSNGIETFLWDDASGYPPRPTQGFFTADELGLMVRRRHTRRPLATEPVNDGIAGRYYQTTAIKAVGQAFDNRRRSALLVMATGSGKTRTTIATVDQLMKANWAKRILFLADRTALVTQGANAFKAHLPDAPVVNLLNDRNADGRVFLSTYPTMMNLIEQQRFGPGFFDLIVVDEAHRSVYAKYGFIFDYFDALLLGLTATPKDQIDHNTYRLFELPDGEPTHAYTLDEAVADGFLVPARGISVSTTYLRDGIRYDDLTDEERAEWDLKDWGDDTPDEVSSGELNKYLFNTDTVDKVLKRLMEEGHRVDDGERLAKTIVFAKNQRHAEFIARRFAAGWPELGPDFARVITHSTDYAQTLIDDFSVADRAPHIAVSVDMLDTGIDVPEVANLVFFKDVHSETKFWQMIGRGTRLCPDLFGPGRDKEDFRVFDFCGNLEYFNQELPTARDSTPRSLTQRITDQRISLLRELDTSHTDADLRGSTARELHAFFSGMNPDNIIVRPHRRAVEHFSSGDVWSVELSDEDVDSALAITRLPSGGGVAGEKDTDAKRFDQLILNLQLARLTGDSKTVARFSETVRAIAEDLLTRTTIPLVKEQAPMLEAVAGDDWWVDVTPSMLEVARVRLRSLVRLVDKTTRNPVYTDFADEISESADVVIGHTTPGFNVERFRNRARAYLLEHSDNIVLQRLQRGSQITASDLDALETMLVDAGGDREDISRVADEAGGLGLFIRSLVGLDRAAAREAFGEFLTDTHFDVEQVRFIDTIIDELAVNGVVERERLFESPFVDIAPNPMAIFKPAELGRIGSILDDVRASAEAGGAA